MDPIATAVITITLVIKPAVDIPITGDTILRVTGFETGYELRTEPVKNGKQYKIIEAR